MEVVTQSAQETQKLGQKIADHLIGQGRGNIAPVIALYGELGSGKTTFTQGLAKGLGLPHRLLSPTFTIVREQELSGLPFARLIHIDLYRVEKSEMTNLGFGEFLTDPSNLIVIEWAEKLDKLPKNRIDIHFDSIDEKRRITIKELDLRFKI